jgi:hypothetical protein
MLHAFSLCGLRRRFVSRRQAGTRVNKQECVGSRERGLQSCRLGKVADEDINAASVERPRLICIAHEDARPVAALDKLLDNE